MRLKLKKPSMLEAFAKTVDLFATYKNIEVEKHTPTQRELLKSRRPSQQSFNESLGDDFSSVGNNLRWSLKEFKKRTG